MLFWIAAACKQAREHAGRIQSQIAASAIVDQATINRFEHHIAWPKVGADRIVTAYADDLDVEVIQLWQQAMRLWDRRRAGESLDDLGIGPPRKGGRRGRGPRAADRADRSGAEATSNRRPSRP